MLNFRSALKLGNLFRMPYYAVAKGRETGIFLDWPTCQSSVNGFKGRGGPLFKKFHTLKDAKQFLKNNGVNIEFESNSESEESPKKSENKPVDFWPSDQECESDDEDFLIAASEEVEGIPSTSLANQSQKRKAIETDRATKSQKVGRTEFKHESLVWHPVGSKKFKNIDFPIDSEGYVICYTDGSCEHNGMRNATAGFGVYFAEKHPLNTAKPVIGRATNNVGEIQAAIYAIKIAKDCDITKLCISTDSQFLINSITMWIKGWKRNNWKLKNSTKPVKNIDEFKELDSLLEDKTIKIKWNYVKGHGGIKGNEMADKLAREGARMFKCS